jgi:hypothetical protein
VSKVSLCEDVHRFDLTLQNSPDGSTATSTTNGFGRTSIAAGVLKLIWSASKMTSPADAQIAAVLVVVASR